MLFPVALFASALFLQQTPPAAPASAPSPAQTPGTTPQSAAAVTVAATPAEPAQTCRMEAVTGSRFGRRVCRNTLQTGEDRANSREMLRQLQGVRTTPVG